MKLDGFSIAEDFIAVVRGSERFDLHNDFDFQSLSFNSSQRVLELRWRRGVGEWVKPAQPSELSLSFHGVYLFKTHERDSEMPFTEDFCVDTLGFIWDDLIAEMGFTSHQPGDGCNHFTAIFMSGFSIKVGAESVALHTAGGV